MRDAVLHVEKDDPVDYDATQHNCHHCIAICVISYLTLVSLKIALFYCCLEWRFNASYSHNLKSNTVIEVNSCPFNSLTPVAQQKLCAV